MKNDVTGQNSWDAHEDRHACAGSAAQGASPQVLHSEYLQKNKNIQTFVYILLSLGIIAAIFWGVWRLNHRQRETISAPSVTETASYDVKSILICKTAFDGLRSTAEKTGAAGMLTMSRNSADPNGCIYNIRSMTSIGNPGIITIDYDAKGGNYSITLEIESGQEELLRDWTKTALFYFNNGINEKIAEEAAEHAFAGEQAAYDLFTINSRIGVNMDKATVTPMRIIEIRNVIDR